MSAQPVWIEHLVCYKKGEDVPMYKSPVIPANNQVKLTEGAKYPEGIISIFEIQFRVAAPIKGLVCHRKVYKLGICVNTEDTNLGDFEPSDELLTYKFPETETPSGFFVRGGFEINLQLTDSDNKLLYQIKYPFEIVKK